MGQYKQWNRHSVVGFDVNATNKAIGLKVVAEQSKVPSKIWVYVHSETGTSPSYDARIETDSSGQPSGTLYHANATATFTATAAGWISATFGSAPAALATGTTYWIVIQPNGAPDGSNYIAVRYHNPTEIDNLRKRLTKTSGSWEAAGTETGVAWLVVEFDDADTMWPDMAWAFAGTQANQSVSDTLYVGVKFTAPINGTLNGVRMAARRSSGTVDATVVVRAVGGGSDLATFTLDDANFGTFVGGFTCFFATPPTLTQGTQYVVYLRGNGAGADWHVLSGDMGTNCPKLPVAFNEGIMVTGTSTDPPATENLRYHIPFGYWIEPATAAGGVKVHPGMVGGIAG
jgi:hypothetical protein